MSAAGRMVPGESSECLEAEHVARYRFACSFARDCSVLDVACGAGYAASMFLAAGARSYLGVDINEEAVANATKKYRSTDAISFLADDACEFRNVPEGAFDLVASFETIEHVQSPEAFLANIRRALKPGGLLVISTPNRLRYSPGNRLSSAPWNPYHVREWNTREFVELLKPWFRVTQLLGQEPIPLWKAHVLHRAARNARLSRLIATLRTRNNRATPSSISPVPSEEALAVQTIRPWCAPLFDVCVAKPQHGSR